MPKLPTFAEFKAEARAAGFDDVLERHWEPHTVVDSHTHPFEVSAIVSRGEMWLSCGSKTQHLRAGDRFTLARELPHAERYGPDGASYWVARRN